MRAPAFALLLALAPLAAGCVLPGGTSGVVGPDGAERSALGVVAEANATADGGVRLVLDARAVDCERREGRVVFEARRDRKPPPPLPAPGEEAAVLFWRERDGGLRYGGTFPAGEYAPRCAHRHEQDVRVEPGRSTEEATPGATAVRITGAPLLRGETTRLLLLVRNAQDAPLDVRLSDLRVVGEEAYQLARPPGEEPLAPDARANLTRVPGCAAASTGAIALTVEPGVAGLVDVEVTCAADAEARRPYVRCEEAHWRPGPAGGEAERVEGGCEERVPRSALVSLWGRLAWTDELGHPHERAGFLWQFLHLADDARLDVEVPARVASRDEFVVEARYVDAAGNPLRNASVTVRLDWPGIESHQFPARFDEATGRWRFAWDDMQEWRPLLWREGERAVTVRAETHEGTHAARTAREVVTFE